MEHHWENLKAYDKLNTFKSAHGRNKDKRIRDGYVGGYRLTCRLAVIGRTEDGKRKILEYI